jgi:hypothetical protein
METQTTEQVQAERIVAAILDQRCWYDAKGIPEGYSRVQVYTNGAVVVVCGAPDSDDESHDCDEMGCGSVGPHVLHFVGLAGLRTTPAPPEPR